MSRQHLLHARQFSRRALLLGLGKIGLFAALGGRLYQLQVLESEKYVTLAEGNRIAMRMLTPPRGRIMDRHGRPIAVNRLNYRVMVVREQARDVEAVLGRLGALIEVGEGDKRRVLREVKKRRAFVPVMIRDELSEDQRSSVELNAPDLPGVTIDVGSSRQYQEAKTLGHILGYVGAVSEAELKAADSPLLEHPDYRIGKNGVERFYEKHLRGEAGRMEVEVNALGRVVRELDRKDGRPGQDLELCVDLDLQSYVRKRLGDESAACVVMDVHKGDVLAMVSAPSYDPNRFAIGLTARDWEELTSDPKTPLINKSLAGQYAPGSTFKMVTALAALEAGVMSPQTVVTCPGHMDLGDHRFHCWKKDGHGPVDLNAALMYSCDVFFYEAARLVGIDRLAAMAKRLGFGGPVGVDLPGEKPGLMPTREWLMKRRGQQWPQGQTLIAGIGQGFVLSTPLQLATMTARLCNGGLAVIPRLGRKIGDEVLTPDAYPSLGLTPKYLRAVVAAMDAVVNRESGTAYKARITEPGIDMAGKTGTAQVRRITLAEREKGVLKNDQIPWRERDHALFVAFAPVKQPKWACSVIVEHGGGGSSVAAPIVRDVLTETHRLDKLRRGRMGA